MDILHALGTVVGGAGSILTGGVTGLLGSGLQLFAQNAKDKLELMKDKQRQDHEVAMLKANAEIMREEWAQRVKVAEVEAAGKESVADSEAFAASLRMEPTRYSEGIEPTKTQAWLLFLLDFLRGIIRPGLTVYLCILTTWIYYQAREILGSQQFTTEMAVNVSDRVINTILYLTTTCVLWWFGTRNKQKAPKV